jgi:hypothetical protein
VQLFSYLDGSYLRQTIELPTAQEKSEPIFLVQPKAHQFKFAETNKTIPTDPLWLVAFFKQCQAADKATSVLDKLKEKKQPKEKTTAHLPVALRLGSNHRHHCREYRNHHQSDRRNCDKH